MRSRYLPARNGSTENNIKKSEDYSKIQTWFTNTKQILHNLIRFCNFRFCSFFYFASIILRLFRIHWSPRSGMVSTADQQISVLWALTISFTIPVIVVSLVFCYCNIFLMISTSNEIECFGFPALILDLHKMPQTLDLRLYFRVRYSRGNLWVRKSILSRENKPRES